MSIADLKNAKDIFFHYRGNHYQMMREGYYDEYKRFNIHVDTEKVWLQELQQINRTLFENSINDKEKTFLFSRIAENAVLSKNKHELLFLLEYINQNAVSIDTNVSVNRKLTLILNEN